MAVFRWRHFAGEIILWAVRWYCRYGISYRELAPGQAVNEPLQAPLGRERIAPAPTLAAIPGLPRKPGRAALCGQAISLRFGS
jgi:hypothetical protein